MTKMFNMKCGCFPRTVSIPALLILAVMLLLPVAAASDTLLETKINPIDGAVMIYIPAGEFQMGDDGRGDNPRHTVTLSGYWIYRDIVTVGMYKKFCQETGRRMPTEPHFKRENPGWTRDDQPMVCVSWNDATAYSKWAGVSLPTDAQFEKSPRGCDGRIFPWGNTFDKCKLWSKM
jgi:formylglycine-generating enzyme required for sulfatase activity